MFYRSLSFPLLLVLVFSVPAARGEYVVNGSLTGDIGISQFPTPWMTRQPELYKPPSTLAPGGFVEGENILGPEVPASPNGGTFLVLVTDAISTAYVGQEINGLMPGRSYSLSFHYANVGAIIESFPLEPEAGTLAVTIAGQQFETEELSYAGPGLQTWHTATFSFIATQPTEYLGFASQPAWFPAGLDGVSIVPEPGALALAGGALIGLFGWIWRREKCPAAVR